MAGRRAWGTAAASAVVAGGTAANRLAGVPLSSMAATPRSIAEGRVWLLVTSGLLASNPWIPSLLGFAIVLAVALWVLSARQVVAAAAAGQILSALVVYAVIGAVRSVDRSALASVVSLPDYGVSTVLAAWIGAVAATMWLRHRGARAHAFVVLGCLGCLGIGLVCRPDLTFLDAEHLVAFALGVAATRILPASRAGERRERRGAHAAPLAAGSGR